MVKILEPYTKNKLSAKDSFTFASEVRIQSSNLFMASLDVEALFTNIPLEETIDICVELAFNGKDKVEGLNRDQFRTLLSLATKESLILFNRSMESQWALHWDQRLQTSSSATMKNNGSQHAQLTSVRSSTDVMLMTFSYCSIIKSRYRQMG